MSKIKFEWDSRKNSSNIRKHKISFEEAKTIFWDENAAVAKDTDCSGKEERFIMIGFSSFARPLLVCFCERDGGETIRIFSARKLTKREIKQFNRRLRK